MDRLGFAHLGTAEAKLAFVHIHSDCLVLNRDRAEWAHRLTSTAEGTSLRVDGHSRGLAHFAEKETPAQVEQDAL
jgi:hypothetical protein